MSGLYGDWNKLRDVLKSWEHKQVKKVAEEVAETIADKVREHIFNQDLNFAPLVEEYRQRKISDGYDPRILIRTGSFVESIEVKSINYVGDKVTVIVGVKEGITETGIDMTDLAEYIEYGTFKQPARMPFHLSWEEMREEIKKSVVDKISVELGG